MDRTLSNSQTDHWVAHLMPPNRKQIGTGGCMCAQSLQLCVTHCNPMDCSPPGSSVHGILQARIPEWVAMLSSKGFDWFPPPRTWCFWTVVLEKILESPLDCREIKPVHPKGNQSWIFIGRTDIEAETPILWPPDVKNWFIGKDPDAGKYWRQEEKGMTEDKVVGWHDWLNGHEFEQALGDDEGQGSLECYSPWGCKELDTTEWTMNYLQGIFWTQDLLNPCLLCLLHWQEGSLPLVPTWEALWEAE